LLFTTLVVFCCTALRSDTPQAVPCAPAVVMQGSVEITAPEDAKSNKPDAPTPKVSSASNESEPSSETAAPVPNPIVNVPVKPVTAESYETPQKRMIWYGLMAAGHGTAAFDAWTTLRAITGGYGLEGDPLERPFAHSNAIYATTQISPLVMDYLGHRMMRSHYPMLRRFWWVPQTASASLSLGAGIHNYRVVP
jgi:hypothetical protein